MRGSSSRAASDNQKLRIFLEQFSLLELEADLLRKGIILEDILKMDDDEMLEAGIKAYRHRKKLLRAIREHLGMSGVVELVLFKVLLRIFYCAKCGDSAKRNCTRLSRRVF